MPVKRKAKWAELADAVQKIHKTIIERFTVKAVPTLST